MRRLRSTRTCHLLALIAIAALLTGCPKPTGQPAGQPEKNPFAGVELKLLVVGDLAIAEAAGRLRSEWQARTGSSLVVSEMPVADLGDLKTLDADAVIYPASLVGQLAEHGLLATVPAEILSGEELAWSDVFETLQVAEATWGVKTVAIPLGSPVLTCMVRADLLEKLHRSPPENWAEYQALAELLARRENLPEGLVAADTPWYGTLEPTSPDWGGRLLLARAAAYAKHRDNYSALFNMNTMQPLIDQPPFVRALEELAAAAGLGPGERTRQTPEAVRRQLLAGHAAMGLTWASAATPKSVDPSDNNDAGASGKLAIGFHPLPGARDVFNTASKSWEQRSADESPRITLLDLEGRVGSVAESSQYPFAAFALLAWLSGKEWSKTVSASSPSTTLFRTSHLAAPAAWADAALDPSAAKQYARVVQQTLSQPTVLFALRLPGHDDYLKALDEAVRSTLAGEQTAAEALTHTAGRWNEITDRFGRESQRRAYLHSLGLEP